MRNVMQLCDTVRETSFAIHQYLKHGHLEKVYENALAHRLCKAGAIRGRLLDLAADDA